MGLRCWLLRLTRFHRLVMTLTVTSYPLIPWEEMYYRKAESGREERNERFGGIDGLLRKGNK